MLEEEKVKKLTMIHGEIDSGSYKSYRYVYSDKSSSNIDCIVDRVISKRYGKQDPRRIIKKRIPTKEIVAIGLSLILLLALIPQILPPLYGDFGNDIIVALDPDSVQLNETLFVNVSIPSYYNITNVSADMAGVETINLELVDNISVLYLWSGVWLVHNATPGENIVTIHALDVVNVSYSTGARLSVIPEHIPEDNQSSENETSETNETAVNETSPGENGTKESSENDTVPEDTIDEDEIIEPIDSDVKTIYYGTENSIEVKEKRTLYSKTFLTEEGLYQERIGIGPIHFIDEDGTLEDIDTSFVLSDDLEYDYEVTKGFYKTKFKKKLDSKNLVEYRFNNFVTQIQLLDLSWSNENEEKVLISQPHAIEGVVQGNRIRYLDAYGLGIDIEFLYHPQYFGKYLIIDSFDSLPIQNSSGVSPYLEFNFKLSLSDNLDIYVNGQRWDGQEVVTQGMIEFKDKNSGKTQFFFKEPYSIDSQGNRNPVSLSIEKQGSDILISKRIDKNWLDQAAYPVMADTIDIIYLEGDVYDMYDEDGTNFDDSDIVQIGRSGGSHWDGYWAFNISEDIINSTINSVTFTGYVSQNDINVNPVMYGLQQDDCPALEGVEDPSTYARTTASYTWITLNGGGTGSKTTGDIDNIFNEWISDHTHNSPPDRFGVVIDDSGAGNNKEVFFYDYNHTSYNSHTYLTIDYTPPPDTDPPTPDPLTWSTEPYETSSSSITMIATTASDDTPPIKYFFNETTGNSGGTDSSWQSSTTYTDSGLSENTQYGYKVKANDSAAIPNEGNYSTPISYEYTDVDPPTDNELTLIPGLTWMNATVITPPNPTSGSTGSNFTWITGGATISDWQNGIYYHNRTGLTENTNYGCQVQYRSGDADASSFNPSEKTSYTLCNPPTDVEFTIDSHGINWINMSVAHPTNPSAGSTAAYFDCVTGGAPDSGWVTDSESGRYYYNATGLSSSTTFGYRVRYRNGNGIETIYTNEKQETTDAGAAKPTVITNESNYVEETNATLNGWLQNNGTADTTCYFLWDTNNPPTANNVSQGVIANGAEFNYDTSSTGALIKGQLYYFDTKAVNTEGWDESGGVKTFLTKPDAPSSLTAQTNSSSMIYLTWNIGLGANNTYIERNSTANWARGDGTEIYNGSGSNYEDTGLTGGTTYYYQAWSFANWTYNPTHHQYSDDNVSANSKTNILPTITSENPENESIDIGVMPQMSITVNHKDGDSMNITWYSNSSGPWKVFGSNVSVGNGTYYMTNSNFSGYGKTYYWNVSVSIGSESNNSDIFHFTTEEIATSVDTISPYIVTYTPFSITATGDSNLGNVTLYYRWSDDNQSWEPWNILTFDDFEDGDFGNYTDGGDDCSLYSGGTYAHSGTYAADIQDDSGDASSFYHTSSIDVDTPGYSCIKVDFWFYSVDLDDGHNFFVEYYNGTMWQILKTYTQGTDFVNDQFYHEIVWINETDYTFPSNMQIKFRCYAGTNNDDVYIDDIWINATTEEAGGNGVNWSIWNNANNPDSDYMNGGWNWTFDFPNGTGYYEFYSIGNLSESSNETAPGSADAICRYPSTSIDITPAQWDVGTTTIGSYNYSTSNGYFNLTNNGTINLNIQIKASNATNTTTGAKWILNETPDFNNYSLQYNKSGGGTWTNINLTYDTFIINLAVESWQTFDLNLFMATTSTKSDPLSITVTFRSVVV